MWTPALGHWDVCSRARKRKAGMCQEVGDEEEPDNGNMGLGVKTEGIAKKLVYFCYLGSPSLLLYGQHP